MISSEAGAALPRWEMPLLNFGTDIPEAKPPTADELQQIEAAAYEDGFARGHAEGHVAGRAAGMGEARQEAQRLSELFDHLARPLGDLDAEVERTLIALAIEVARRLVDQQLQLDPELTANTVRAALASLSATPREARVHLHPADAALLQETMTPPPDVVSWRLVPDAELRRGDVRLRTESGQVDALLDTRQAGIARALLGEGE